MKLSCNTCRSLSISFEWLYRGCDTSTSMPQWGCVKVYFVDNGNHAPYETWKSTYKWQNHSFVVNNYISQAVQLYFKPYKQEKWRTVRQETVCHGCLLHFLNTASYTSLYDSPWNLRKRMTKPQHRVKQNLSPKLSVNDIKRYKQLKLNFDEMLSWQHFQKTQL